MPKRLFVGGQDQKKFSDEDFVVESFLTNAKPYMLRLGKGNVSLAPLYKKERDCLLVDFAGNPLNRSYYARQVKLVRRG